MTPRAQTLAFERHGDGLPVLALHGIASRRQVWAPLVAALDGRFETWALDLPGHGDSPPLDPSVSWDVIAYVDAVERFLDQHDLERPHLVGNSLGGAMALELARRGRAASAVAVAPIGFWSTPEVHWCIASLRLSAALAQQLGPVTPRLLGHAPLRTLMLGQMFGRPTTLRPDVAEAELAAFVSGADTLRTSLPYTRRYRFDGAPPTVPVAVAWGTRDALLPPWQARRARRLVPDAHHARLPRAGHVGMVDAPEAVARLVLDTAAAGSDELPERRPKDA